MKPSLMRSTPVLLALCAASAFAAPPHEHGVGRLDVAVEHGRVTLLLEMPLDSLVGFEHAPRNAVEREAARAALAKLHDAARLWRVDAAAGCAAPTVEIGAGPIEAGEHGSHEPAHAHDDGDGHADAEASFSFECSAAERAAFVDTGLLESFPRLRTVNVQLATRQGQWKTLLTRPMTRLPLVR
ncbi:ZrgA family zinc uptake protein [Rubrivivax gelatinosus]|uniref:ZrgA family zinc uptake protein n=1 Tax=Rubrivivax gelatinosus TaxID=28068 RepID=UPI001F5BC218|nr:DUF2796 domain-containing protein [Rubrivivax gelatinosus]